MSIISRLQYYSSSYIKYICRNLHTMKLNEDQMKHILRPGVVILSDLFTKNGFEIRVAGGAVRDMLLGKIPKDLDFATTATPSEMKHIFEQEEIRMVNAGGEKHGTITARIEEENFECTTLRIDKVTDGRHAEVEFIRDWKLDAGRRDLTINALFLGLDGTVYDYFDGIEHVKSQRILFVGDPNIRIQEDYLRILRYFRFFGRIATENTEHDQSVLEAIKQNCKGLSRISGERIWVELKKILCGRFSDSLLTKIVECNVGIQIGLPIDFDTETFSKVYERLKHNENNSSYEPCTLLASGFHSVEDAVRFIERVKCSNKEKDTLLNIINYREIIPNENVNKFIKDILVDMIYKEKKSKEPALFVVTELLKYCGRTDVIKEVISSEFIPHFPIKGGLLVDRVKKRNQIQKEVRRLLELWKESDYTLTREDLLNQVQPE